MEVFYLEKLWLREDLEVCGEDKGDSSAGQCQEGLGLPRRGAVGAMLRPVLECCIQFYFYGKHVLKSLKA